jgi:hypothetical protein
LSSNFTDLAGKLKAANTLQFDQKYYFVAASSFNEIASRLEELARSGNVFVNQDIIDLIHAAASFSKTHASGDSAGIRTSIEKYLEIFERFVTCVKIEADMGVPLFLGRIGRHTADLYTMLCFNDVVEARDYFEMNEKLFDRLIEAVSERNLQNILKALKSESRGLYFNAMKEVDKAHENEHRSASDSSLLDAIEYWRNCREYSEAAGVYVFLEEIYQKEKDMSECKRYKEKRCETYTVDFETAVAGNDYATAFKDITRMLKSAANELIEAISNDDLGALDPYMKRISECLEKRKTLAEKAKNHAELVKTDFLAQWMNMYKVISKIKSETDKNARDNLIGDLLDTINKARTFYTQVEAIEIDDVSELKAFAGTLGYVGKFLVQEEKNDDAVTVFLESAEFYEQASQVFRRKSEFIGLADTLEDKANVIKCAAKIKLDNHDEKSALRLHNSVVMLLNAAKAYAKDAANKRKAEFLEGKLGSMEGSFNEIRASDKKGKNSLKLRLEAIRGYESALVHFYSGDHYNAAREVGNDLERLWKNTEEELGKFSESESQQSHLKTGRLTGAIFAATSIFCIVTYLLAMANWIKTSVVIAFSIPQLGNALAYLCLPLLFLYPLTLSILLMTNTIFTPSAKAALKWVTVAIVITVVAGVLVNLMFVIS